MSADDGSAGRGANSPPRIEGFYEALARIRAGMLAQPDGDKLGYLKASIENCTALHPADRAAIFDLLMTLPSPTAPSVNVTQNVQQSQTANPNVTQNVTQSTPSVPSGDGKPKGSGSAIKIIVALIAAAGAIGAAYIGTRGGTKDEAKAAATNKASSPARAPTTKKS